MTTKREIEWIERKLDEFKLFNAIELCRWQWIKKAYDNGDYKEAIRLIGKRRKRDLRRKKRANP